ncbi:hypothetical protein GO001_17625 [Streptomyces sp. NRRL B-1677]|uniref:DUF6603 domain-containing protein n=1 Tax=Streptomyces sp. NRRL B-1677 TaxID=2682966 RepID=UPI001892BB51|nr:DUF6603 domain-containing protein [Streptomyces sp. NRRL B-1677]MBF6047033.1 hypothetical protein [Streptomyces sp. NRRL B-1677]
MALSVDTLRATLRAAQEQRELTVTPEYLELPPAADLFTEHLADGVLHVREADIDAARLTAAGTVGLASGTDARTAVHFLADDAGTTVVGVRIDAALPPGSQDLPKQLRDALVPLERFGLGTLHLVLGAEPGLNDEPEALTGVGAELDFPDAQAALKPYVWGYPPQAGAIWRLGARFAPVPLTGLDALRSFAAVGTGGFDLPPDLAPDSGLALTGLAIAYAAGNGSAAAASSSALATGGSGLAAGADDGMLSVSLSVDLGRSWEPLEGVTVGGLYADFTVQRPFSGPRLLATLGGHVQLADDIGVDIEVRLPDRALTGTLSAPVDAGRLLQDRFPGLPLPTTLTVSELTLWAELASAAENRGYGLGLALTDVWQVVPGIGLDQVVLTVSHQAGLTLAGLAARWTLDEGVLDVAGTWSSADGWAFTAHAVALQPAAVMSHLGIDVPEALRDLTIEELAVAFDTRGRFTFACTTTLTVGETPLALTVTVVTDRDGGSTQVSGILRLTVPLDDETERVLEFAVDYTGDPAGRTLTARWTGTPGITSREIAAALGLPVPAGVPAGLLPTLTSVGLRYETRAGRLLLAATTEAGGGIVVASVPGTPRALVLLVAANLSDLTPTKLSQLPLVGGQIPESADVGLTGIQFLVTGNALTTTQVQQVNADLEAVGWTGGKLPDTGSGLPKGAVLTLPYEIAGQAQDPLAVSFGGDGQKQLAVGNASASGQKQLAVRNASAGGPESASWVDIGRSFGPLHLQRIGAGFDSGKALVMFDASMGAAGFTLGVIGLGIALDLDTMSAEPRLQGLSVDLRRNPLHIAGTLANRQPPPEHYKVLVEGMLVVEMPTFGALALGAYQRRDDGMTSFFAFGRLTGTFGGPPPFRVTAFALGFGYNSSVRVPEQAEISAFPLVSGLDGDLPDDPLKALPLLTGGPKPWVSPAEGQIWLAGGIDFTSFEFVQARVLLLLEAGNALTLALIGRAEASFPKKGTRKYARIGVDLRIVYQSARGEFAATAQLVDSYVIDPSCVLTGGFAFCSWFGPSAHAGDFVLTVGGYHPDYKPVPSHFPVVPRLGFTWSVGSAVTVSGGAYFALTPNAVMAGGSLDVRFKAGNVEAWLTAQANLLIQWAPLHFRAGISVRVGARVKLLFTVSGEIGASLDLWGPPTGGTVTAKFVFIKVTVKFGAALSGPDPLTWGEFRDQLLPPEAPLTAHALTGLLTDSDADPVLRAARIDAGEEPWLADPAGFSFAVSTAVPTARARFNARDPEGSDTVDIRPMKVKDIDGLLHVTVEYSDTRRRQVASWRSLPNEDKWQIDAEHGNVPFALWGDPDVPQDEALGEEPLLDHLTGLRVTVPPPRINGQDLGTIAERDLSWEKLADDAALPLDPHAGPTGSPVELAAPLGAGVGVLADRIADLAAGSARTRMHTVLAGLCPDIPLPNGTVSAYAEQARTAGLDADPLLLTEDPAPPAPGPVVLVLDDTTGAVLSVDPDTATVVGRVPVGQPGPYLAVTSADGATLYAAGTNPRELAVIDVIAQQVRAPRTGIQLAGQPTILTVKRDGSRAVVARPAYIAAAAVDLTGGTEPIRTDVEHQDVQAFGGIAVDVEAGRLYVNANDGTKTLTYDTSTGEKLGVVYGPATPTFVTPGEPGRVYVYGAAAGTKGQVQVTPVPASGVWYAPYNFPVHGTALAMLTGSARRAVVLRKTGDSGHVVTLYERTGSTPVTIAEHDVAVGPDPRSLALDPAARAWVLHGAAVSVVSGDDLLGALPLDARPLSVTFTPDATRAFVACDDASVTVIEIHDNAPVATAHWPLPSGTVASAALYTVFADTASEGAAR